VFKFSLKQFFETNTGELKSEPAQKRI